MELFLFRDIIMDFISFQCLLNFQGICLDAPPKQSITIVICRQVNAFWGNDTIVA